MLTQPDRFDVDECRTSTELYDFLRNKASGELTLTEKSYLPDKEQEHRVFHPWHLDILHRAIDECRVIKDAYEIACIRRANLVTTAAHIAVMKSLRSARNEQELEAVFLERSIALGCKNQAYHGIFGSGQNAATLHYQANNQSLEMRLNVLVDAAVEWQCYCADVTRTYPLHGLFNKESEEIFTIVRSMQAGCLAMLKEGVQWEAVHALAHEIAIEGLLALGILKGDKKELFEARTSVAFFPHGLGHYLGLDTHDTGGHPDYDDEDKMFQYLRVRGQLPEGSVITVEPGIYFCKFIINPYLEDEKHKMFIDEGVLSRYWGVGGVRIE